ncbi:RHS repeat domain-containing protein [Hoylesella timonensis]|uniref:RHS repeat domain-containing protein n=1 Tax=Hoylesella timonensis TaxID=386414 RepID=UPI000AC0FCED|nr:hypothetical protein [Hoylesella timonensis]
MIKIEGKTEKDNLCPRIGGEAFIKEKDWPRNNNGIPLSLLFSIPLEVVSSKYTHREALFLSVFTTYTDDYFLDDIIDNGDLQGLPPIWTNGTRVLIRKQEATSCSLGISIPSYKILLPSIDNMRNSMPSYLQSEPELPVSSTFLFQFDLINFPLELQNILFLSDAIGYVFIDMPHCSGIFFCSMYIVFNMGLPVEERSNEHVIKRTYDKAGQIATLTSSLGADLTYERNEFGELTCFSAGQAEAPGRFESRHEYDSLGFELERILPGGVTQSFPYDDIGRLIDSKTRQSSKVRRERKYHWGSADRLLKTEDNRFGTTTYEYSPTGHLQKGGLFCLIIPTYIMTIWCYTVDYQYFYRETTKSSIFLWQSQSKSLYLRAA